MADLITQSEFARRHNVTRQAVNDWVTRGVIQLVEGRLDETAALQAIAAVHDPTKPQRILVSGPTPSMAADDVPKPTPPDEKPKTPDEAVSFHVAKTRREMAEAERAELKLAKERRELAPVHVLETALERVAARIAAILDAVPVNVARAAPHLSRSDLDLITQQIAQARNAAADLRLDLDPVDDNQDADA